MNKKLFIGLLLALGILILGTVGWYFLFFTPAAVVPSGGSTQTNGNFPVSGTTEPVPTASSTSTTGSTSTLTQIKGQAGMVVMNDFIHNGVTIKDPSNPGNYLLAGSFGCVPNPEPCTAEPVKNFTVYYNGAPQSFTITLNEEPLGASRLAMEAFMMRTLGLTEVGMCSLNYYVGVRSEVNEQYSGKNLGFSFCPAATRLP